MRGTPTMTTAQMVRVTLAEADQCAPSSYEYAALIRAAWTLQQIADGIPCSEWTPPPAWFGPGYQMEAA